MVLDALEVEHESVVDLGIVFPQRQFVCFPVVNRSSSSFVAKIKPRSCRARKLLWALFLPTLMRSAATRAPRPMEPLLEPL